MQEVNLITDCQIGEGVMTRTTGLSPGSCRTMQARSRKAREEAGQGAKDPWAGESDSVNERLAPGLYCPEACRWWGMTKEAIEEELAQAPVMIGLLGEGEEKLMKCRLDQKEFRIVVSKRREALGFTREELAEKAGAEASQVADLETGRTVDNETLGGILIALDIAEQGEPQEEPGAEAAAEPERTEPPGQGPRSDTIELPEAAELGLRFKARRKALGLSKNRVCQGAGIANSTLNRVESGASRIRFRVRDALEAFYQAEEDKKAKKPLRPSFVPNKETPFQGPKNKEAAPAATGPDQTEPAKEGRKRERFRFEFDTHFWPGLAEAIKTKAAETALTPGDWARMKLAEAAGWRPEGQDG